MAVHEDFYSAPGRAPRAAPGVCSGGDLVTCTYDGRGNLSRIDDGMTTRAGFSYDAVTGLYSLRARGYDPAAGAVFEPGE